MKFFSKSFSPSSSAALFLLALLLIVMCVSGCENPILRPGEVARVNGRTITFAQLDAVHASLFSGSSNLAHKVDEDQLRRQYNSALFQLIAQELVCQYMDKKGVRVSAEELKAAENVVRNDYPAGEFEVMLVEEAINIDNWRELLYRRMMVELFHARFLRPSITISPDDVQAYYREHSGDFLVPEQWNFIQISGPDKELVEQAAAQYLESKDPAQVELGASTSMRDISMDPERLPEEISASLQKLKPLQASRVQRLDADYCIFILLKKTPAYMREASETFILVEQALAEDRLHEAYLAWLKDAVSRATILVADPLLPFEPVGLDK